MDDNIMRPCDTSTRQIPDRIISRLPHPDYLSDILRAGTSDVKTASVVLFLLGMTSPAPRGRKCPCLILNKRSLKVTQPGDLCCPGGGISPAADAVFARLLRTENSPLARWNGWPDLKKKRPDDARKLSLLFATALREGFEEMRLNPFRVRFLGVLPPQKLILFRRTIFPMVCWLPEPGRFYPNHEVDAIVTIPFETLTDASRYAVYRVRMEHRGRVSWKDFPCFLHDGCRGREILWGATFRMTMDFLKLTFDFQLPESRTLPVVFGSLGRRYLKGSRP